MIREAAAVGISGATVIAAEQGFGRRHSHRPTFWHRADETPLTVIFIDQGERIAAFLEQIVRPSIPDVVAVTSTVRTIRFGPSE